MRLDKYLCDCNIGTRSEVKNLIKKNNIFVNGQIIKDASYQVNEADEIRFKDEVISYKKYHYFICNKPGGVITAREDDNSMTIMELLNIGIKNLSPVGRLDKDTEGLLLITDDGKLNHNMLSPKKHVDKTYYVEAEHNISDEDIQRLCNGLDINDDILTLPAKCERISCDKVYLTIQEGRFHQVKRMFLAINNKVIFLKRVSFGPLVLDENLKTGEYRELNEDELSLLSNYH